MKAPALLRSWVVLAVAWLLACASGCGDDAGVDDKPDARVRDASAIDASDGSTGSAGRAGAPAAGRGGGAGRDDAGAMDGGGRPRFDAALPQPSDGSVLIPEDAMMYVPPDAMEPPPYDEELALASVSAGYNHACGIDLKGALLCWGANGSGQLGLSDQEPRAGAVRVGGASDWRAVATGRFHTCGLREGGKLYCWGASTYGQAGWIGEAVTVPEEVALPEGESGWSAVSTGNWHTCALTAEGSAYCFGYNLLGRLGDGTGAGTMDDPEAIRIAPVKVALPRAAVAIAAGGAHSCAIDGDGSLWCWGAAEDGELGAEPASTCTLSGSSVACSLTPLKVDGSEGLVAVSLGERHGCSLDGGGNVRCWGANDYGQLGTGTLEPASSPQRVGRGYSAIATGFFHSCALREDGALECFGDNSNDQFGAEAESGSSPAPAAGERRWESVSAGAIGACAVEAETNFGYCWGSTAYSGASSPALIVPL